jgi:hypothetical protein
MEVDKKELWKAIKSRCVNPLYRSGKQDLCQETGHICNSKNCPILKEVEDK